MSGRALSADDLARLAEVDRAFVERAAASGALTTPAVEIGFTREDAARVRLLHMWETAGLPMTSIVGAVERGELSFAFLDNPTMAVGDRLDMTYDVLCDELQTGLDTVRALHVALGFAAPGGGDLARSDDPLLIAVFRALTAAGAGEDAVLRVFRVYADSLRRIAQAELEFYEAEVERPMRRAGATDLDLLDRGAGLGRDLMASIEEMLLAIYRRRRSHVWLDHSVSHAEIVLEGEGVYHRAESPPCVCFVDLAGYTRITEELGDAAAAEMAAGLASLISGISQRHDGRPVRWLGDGGMFVFRDPGAAVAAAREMVAEGQASGLPPTHIGIHCGPVVFQDGDIYGGTVNIAARLSARAGAGEILVSVAVATGAPGVAFESLGPVELKGVNNPIQVHRVISS